MERKVGKGNDPMELADSIVDDDEDDVWTKPRLRRMRKIPSRFKRAEVGRREARKVKAAMRGGGQQD